MGINRRNDRRGRPRWYVDKRWPDGVQFRRVVPTRRAGVHLLARIEESIAVGTWRRLRLELSSPSPATGPRTVAELAGRYLEHCNARNRRPDFKKQVLSAVKRILGDVRLAEFRRLHAHLFVERRKSEKVSPATINRGLAVLKHMLSYAVEVEVLESNPLLGFRLLSEPERPLRVMTLEEERLLVGRLAHEHISLGAMGAVVGETGLRKSEALRLKWSDIDTGSRLLSVSETKSGRVRHVPLTRYALEWLARLERIVGVPQVFLRGRSPWRRTRARFRAARDAAGLHWVRGWHDLRHFRATQWVRHGVDLGTVKELLGHADISTTMRYAHFSATHAIRSVHEVERLELESFVDRDASGTTG